ncbi:branched-chain amino acid aminotransferase [Segetibacter sp. 3557_3]|uniref:branched-chain amino acid aminotransferase n=1 Tax=Segetibacter sp. 3557_3 TaxID=2547429 RepID=UPI0010589BF4|nr:branched-chain amino acid aminotransferase [Segetibacter sp. 3557_3]TDH26826.1 branched-chain amino acid aminotransferase [Segetibacter sp. 3557_3]
MIEASEIIVQKAASSRLSQVTLKNVPFGKYFTDHMLEADYENGEWKAVEIKPYAPLQLDPATAALHYGQAIFEGIKAYKDINGSIAIFRPFENFRRFNVSAERMQMPAVPEEIFIEGMRALINLDQAWIPDQEDHSLYIRPFMIATDDVIGVKPSEKYKFLIILSPTGPYYDKPMRIYVEENYTRAAPGGIGFAKAAANYGASMLPTAKAKELGYDQVLWTDAFEHRYVQEIGTMNVFFVIGDTAYTPDLSQGTILDGITRDSVITVLGDMGLSVVEREISIDEIVAAYAEGQLKEVFGTGTAAVISSIRELRYKDYVMEFDVSKWTIAPEVKSRLAAIRNGSANDEHGWLYRIS